MNDETGLPAPEPTGSSEQTTGEAWDTVVARMNDLSAAVASWTRAAAREPDTREKLDQFRAGIDDIGMKADAALGRAMRSDTGRAIGDAAHAVNDMAAPHVRSLFSELANVFEKAAQKVDEVARPAAEPAPPVEEAAAKPKDPLSSED